MKKILWFSNCAFSDEKTRVTGTWLIAMGEALVETGEVELYNVTTGNVRECTQHNCKKITQWVLPTEKRNKSGLPSKKTIDFIRGVEQEVKPDLVHIWGTENYWGMLAANGYLSAPILLDIQGVLSAITRVFYGGLTNKELLQCIGLKEILLPKRLLFSKKNNFEKRSKDEQIIIKNIRHIATQSDWVRANIEYMKRNTEVKMYSSGILLREEFYQAEKWKNHDSSQKVIFTSSAGINSFKGLHVLFRAIALLKRKYPNIELHIAGSKPKRRFIQDGYFKWLQREARNLEIIDSVRWLGTLNADQIIGEFHKSSLIVIPSYVESYCLALAEAMMVGLPAVVSYAGAMPELAKQNESALFFPVGDYVSCAHQMDRLLSNADLMKKISELSTLVAAKRNNQSEVVNNQLAIYSSII